MDKPSANLQPYENSFVELAKRSETPHAHHCPCTARVQWGIGRKRHFRIFFYFYLFIYYFFFCESIFKFHHMTTKQHVGVYYGKQEQAPAEEIRQSNDPDV